MHYTIQPGDTITDVTRRLGIDWETLRTSNPKAVGRSARTGRSIIKAGATVRTPDSFADLLARETAARVALPTTNSAGRVTAAFAAPRPAGATTPAIATGVSLPEPVAEPAKGGETIHVLQKGENVWTLAAKKYHVDPQAILRLNNITNPKNLQIGQQLRIPAGEQGSDPATDVVASWYGQYHHGRIMANGEPDNKHGHTIAHRDMPLGTRVELENPETGEKARATVTDRGPYVEGRDVDLSYRLARKLSLSRQGVANLKMRVL